MSHLVTFFFRSRSGLVAAIAAFLGLAALAIFLVDQPSPLDELRSIEGQVIQVRTEDSLKSSYGVWLTIRDDRQETIEVQYFVNKGDNKGNELQLLQGKRVRAWFEESYINTLYQLSVSDVTLVDYEERKRQVSGDPRTIAIYSSIACVIFVVALLVRRRELAQSRAA